MKPRKLVCAHHGQKGRKGDTRCTLATITEGEHGLIAKARVRSLVGDVDREFWQTDDTVQLDQPGGYLLLGCYHRQGIALAWDEVAAMLRDTPDSAAIVVQ